MVTREKKELIKKLIKDNLGWEQICKQAHCSPNTIKKVIEQGKQKVPKLKSTRTLALKMFDKGHSCFDVATKLDISAEETECHELEYAKLKRMDEFVWMYNADKANLGNGLRMAQEFQTGGITFDEFKQIFARSMSISQLQNEEYFLEKRVQLMREDYRQRQCELWNITKETKKVISQGDENRLLHSALRGLANILVKN